jgi:hypothetical protein
MYIKYYIASKIDFFNAENQRKLDISKRKILIDTGLVPSPPKKRIKSLKTNKNISPSLHLLLQRYVDIKCIL